MSFEKELSFYADFLNGYEGEKAGFLVISDSENEMSKFLELALGCVGERDKRFHIKPMFYTDKVLWRTPNLTDFIQNKEYLEELKVYLNWRKENGDVVIDYVILFLHKEITSEYLSFIQQLESYNDRLIVMIEKPDLSMKCKLETQERIELSNLGLSENSIVYSIGDSEKVDDLPPYNLAKFLYCILSKLPENKRTKLLSNSVNVMRLSSSKNAEYNDDTYYMSQLMRYDLENEFRKTNEMLEANHKFVEDVSEFSKQLIKDLKENNSKEEQKTKLNALNNALKVGAAIVTPLGLLGLYRFFKK